MELNDMELNYIYFHDEANSDDASNNSKCGGFFLTGTKGVYIFYLNFLTETFVLKLCNFNVAESTNIVGTAFLQKRKYLQSFQF